MSETVGTIMVEPQLQQIQKSAHRLVQYPMMQPQHVDAQWHCESCGSDYEADVDDYLNGRFGFRDETVMDDDWWKGYLAFD
jgi:hypothetical protein